jgi:hypothetical protein
MQWFTGVTEQSYNPVRMHLYFKATADFFVVALAGTVHSDIASLSMLISVFNGQGRNIH